MSSAQGFTLPELFCPFTVAVHPRAEEIEERMMNWAVARGLPASHVEEERIRRTRWGALVARCFPFGDFERTLLFAKLYLLISEYDHIFLEEPASAGRPDSTASNLLRLLTIVNDPDRHLPANATSWDRAWREWIIDFAEVATPFQHSRFLTGMAEYCMGGACEAIYRGRSAHPPLEEYLAIRRFTAALRLSFVTVPIEVTCGYELSPAVWHQPDVVALTKSGQTVYAFTNDILSCLRDPEMSLPAALAVQHNWPLQQAIGTAVDMLRQETETFIGLAGELRSQPAPLPDYIDAIQTCLAGHYSWYSLTSRYGTGDSETTGSVSN